MVLTATEPRVEPPVRRLPGTPWLAVSGLASVAAGVVHAAAAGAHGEHRAAVLVFTALALAQVTWGAAALARGCRTVAALGALLGLGALAGWALAKTAGLPVDGLDQVEPIQLADASAAALALLSAATAALAVRRASRGIPLPLWSLALAAVVAAAAGTVATSGHEHAGHGDHTSAAAHVHAVPYDPSRPIDLGGTPGVTPQQQAAAEQLVVVTLARLPQWADAAVAERAGFRSIGDGFTGTEHLINQRFLTDNVTLDPDRPESLVYDTTGGGRRLVAAMYMLKPGTSLADVPDVGGKLVQWHIHDNLCFTRTGLVRGITDITGACPAGLVKPLPAPMVHVWITKNPCGPFAALEGIGGGRIAAGQTRLCDHQHGSAS